MNNRALNPSTYFLNVLRQNPTAFALVSGSEKYPGINGRVNFYETRYGVLVQAQIFSLPTSQRTCNKKIFAFHIHSGTSCSGNSQDPFADALTHYNPENCAHPNHAGDLPPLFGNNGYAFEIFLTNKFSVNEIIGKTVIIHSQEDDFTTQPAGNSGEKIACGVIRRSLPRRTFNNRINRR